MVIHLLLGPFVAGRLVSGAKLAVHACSGHFRSSEK